MTTFKTEFSPFLATSLLALALSGCGGGSEAITGSASLQGITASPLSHVTALTSMDYQAVRNLNGTGIGGTLSPADLTTHYNIQSPNTGSGQTIAIVAAPGSGNIANDLNTFSNYYKLPQCTAANPCFQKIDLSNGAVVPKNNDWKVEIALDVEWSHAIAPSAKILLVVAKSSSMADMMAAVQRAAAQPGVVAVSMSWGAGEYSAETAAAYDGVFKYHQNNGIVFLAASGDSGNNGSNQIYPAASPFVTAVGGTSIKSAASVQPTTTTEIAWTYGGGGASLYEAMPSYQTVFLSGSQTYALNNGKRAIPDVAYNADANSSPVGVYVNGSWYAVGGTSAGAPQWGAIVALAANHLAQNGKPSLQDLVKSTAGGFNGLIYQAKLATSFDNTSSFFDITVGSDGTGRRTCALCSATQGYDDVTGLGVPNVSNLLVALR